MKLFDILFNNENILSEGIFTPPPKLLEFANNLLLEAAATHYYLRTSYLLNNPISDRQLQIKKIRYNQDMLQFRKDIFNEIEKMKETKNNSSKIDIQSLDIYTALQGFKTIVITAHSAQLWKEDDDNVTIALLNSNNSPVLSIKEKDLDEKIKTSKELYEKNESFSLQKKDSLEKFLKYLSTIKGDKVEVGGNSRYISYNLAVTKELLANWNPLSDKKLNQFRTNYLMFQFVVKLRDYDNFANGQAFYDPAGDTPKIVCQIPYLSNDSLNEETFNKSLGATYYSNLEHELLHYSQELLQRINKNYGWGPDLNVKNFGMPPKIASNKKKHSYNELSDDKDKKHMQYTDMDIEFYPLLTSTKSMMDKAMKNSKMYSKKEVFYIMVGEKEDYVEEENGQNIFLFPIDFLLNIKETNYEKWKKAVKELYKYFFNKEPI